jgi:integrase
MNIEKLPSGSFRVRKMINGRTISMTFDRKPTQKEIQKELERRNVFANANHEFTFKVAAEEYMQSKKNVLSTTTIKNYNSILKNLSDTFKNKKVDTITAMDVQREINDYSATRSPKSVKNASGFIAVVLSMYSPDLRLKTKLPQNIPHEEYIPSKEDIEKVLKYAEGTDYELILKLACFGFRKGEMLAITPDDVKDDIVTVSKSLAVTDDGSYDVKTTKTESGIRQVRIGKELANKIKEQGYVYNGFPGNVLRFLHKAQDAVGVPRFKLHAFRHYYVSMCHAMGIPDVYIIKSIGHRTDTTLKRVYRHEIEQETLKVQKDIEKKVSELF